MSISETQIRQVHLPPEVIPDTWVGDIAASQEAVPPILELRRFSPFVVHLQEIAVEQDDQVEVRVRGDTLQFNLVAGSLRDLEVNPFDILAKDNIWFNLWASAMKSDLRAYYGLRVYQPTVAHKLAFGISLTAEERRIESELGISKSVQKGVLPLPWSLQREREYQVMAEETHGRILGIGTATTAIEAIHPRVNEFVVLTGIACDPGAAGDAITVTIDRDQDANYVPALLTHPLALTRDLSCFIPALTEIRLSVVAAGAVADWNVRYTFLRCRMTNLLRVRFGLVSKEELPEPSLWDKVKGGVL